MAAQRKVWLEKNAKEHEKKGLSPKRAMAAAVQLLDNGVLFPTGSVIFDDGADVSVLDLLTDGSAHDRKTCKDPVEPDYNGGASVGQYYWNDGEGPGIHSFAHGSRWYAIKYDPVDFEALIKEATKTDLHKVISAFLLTEFDSETEKALAEESAAKALGLGRKVKAFRNDVAAEQNGSEARAPEIGLIALTKQPSPGAAGLLMIHSRLKSYP